MKKIEDDKIFKELESTIENYIEKIKKRLIESELIFNNMFTNHDSIMLLINPDNGNIVEANISASKFYGYSISELCSMNISEINNLTLEQVVYEYTNAKNQKNNSFEFPHKMSDETLKYVEVHSSPIMYKGNNYLFSIINDITDREKLTKEFKFKSSLLEAQIKSNIEAIVIVDSDISRRLLINDQLIELFQLPKEIVENDDSTVMLNYIANLTTNPKDFIEKAKYLYSNLDISRDEIRLINGKILDRYSAPVLGENNENYGRIWSYRDITNIKNAEKEIRRKNDKLKKINDEKDTLLSIISHDLRGSLGTIMQSTKLLSDKNTIISESDRNDWLIEISKSAEKSFNLLNELLEWSKLVFIKPNVEKLYLKDIINNILSLSIDAIKNKSINLIIDIPEEQQHIHADINILQTIIRNFISNAIKFTPNNGTITIYSKILSNDIFSISVKDTGIGMTENIKDNLFNKDFYTSRTGINGEVSNGVGLLLCKDLIEKHNGTLTIESKQDKGSTFTFTIKTKKHEH